ncbi:MAG TPA: PAS domain-containing protein, partial [Polyangiaceae bacterium]|nr:PAS domain-containing protein [Polyangiaceae bacterium]
MNEDAEAAGEESALAGVLADGALTLAMLEGLPTPLCLRDRQSRYVWANAAFCSAFGRAKAELIGKTDFDLLPHEQALLEQIRDERVFRD